VPEFLATARRLTERHGALLVFDEVMTGFRLALGGAQEILGVTPDLTILGKIVGGGLPLAAYGGRADVMDHVLPAGKVFQAGTLAGNPLAVAAGTATLEELAAHPPYAELERRGALLEAGFRAAAAAAGLTVWLARAGSMLTMFFQPGPEPDGLRRELGLGSRHRVVMIVARLTPWKGHAELLRALPRVVNRFPDARLVVVGTTNFWQAEYLDELQALAEDQGVGHAVLWTGHRQDIPELLRLCEMLVLPSRDEPFGRSLVEAMATGKPVVAGRGGAAPEICPDGLCGYLVDHDDPAEIADGLLALLTDPERAAEMGRAGRRRALDLFDADANAERVQALYRDLLH